MAGIVREEARPVQAWRGLMNWLYCLVQIVVSILRGTPSLAQILSYIGFSSATRHLLSASSPSFQTLPVVELPLQELLPTAHVSIEGTVSNCRAGGDDHRAEKLTECEGKPRVSYVTVFERPGLQEFLKQINEFADLVLFTAGVEDYARPLVDRIDMDNRFRHRLYRPSTVTTVYREHVKDLSCLSKDLSRIVIVDNNPFSFLLQPLNGIPCIPFSVGQPYDNQLLEVLLPLLRLLYLQNDVRPVLYERFHMPEWFQMHGIPASGLTV